MAKVILGIMFVLSTVLVLVNTEGKKSKDDNVKDKAEALYHIGIVGMVLSFLGWAFAP